MQKEAILGKGTMKGYQKIEETLVFSLKDKTKGKKLLLGVSGGIDSAVVATLCARAKPDETHALIMPTASSNKENMGDALNLCEKLNIKYKVLSIEGILNAFYKTIDVNLSNLRKGNLAARVRMSLLYDYSSSINALVIGTSNKSELMLGYGTIFGDLACAINPIGELYKSEIFEFAKHLGVDENFIKKAPSADLWDGQSDEGDIGYSYAVIDEILQNLENNKEQAIKKFGSKAVLDIENRVVSNRFKRQMPLIVKI